VQLLGFVSNDCGGFGSISIPRGAARRITFDAHVQIIPKMKPYPFLQFVAIVPPLHRRKNAASRTHIFHYDVADSVTVIHALRRSIAHIREHTQRFDYFPNPCLATAVKTCLSGNIPVRLED
jgi:hypothetical protein